jgi:hypothetical protein
MKIRKTSRKWLNLFRACFASVNKPEFQQQVVIQVLVDVFILSEK